MDSSVFTANVCYVCAFIAVLVSSASQILLKQQANDETKRKGFIWKFLNWRVIVAYGFLFLSLALNQVALIQVPVSVLPCITATSFLWIFLFSALFLKEKPTRRKVLGVIIILAGVAISRL